MSALFAVTGMVAWRLLDGPYFQWVDEGCFPHLIGATTRPALWEDEGGNVQHMYRSGIFARLREALVDQEHLALLKQYIYFTRHCPKGLFAGLWANMVAYLENHGERRAVQLLNGRYLFRSLAWLAVV